MSNGTWRCASMKVRLPRGSSIRGRWTSPQSSGVIVEYRLLVHRHVQLVGVVRHRPGPEALLVGRETGVQVPAVSLGGDTKIEIRDINVGVVQQHVEYPVERRELPAIIAGSHVLHVSHARALVHDRPAQQVVTPVSAEQPDVQGKSRRQRLYLR